MVISPILPITHSWTKHCMADLLSVWNHRQPLNPCNRTLKRVTTLSMNLSKIWWVSHSELRATMIGKKRLGSEDYASKTK